MTSMALIGLNHKSALIGLRERFAFDQQKQVEILNDFTQFVDEVVIICTCNRTEFIYHSENGNGRKHVERYIRELGALSNADYDKYFYEYENSDVLKHLCRVAAGLDSLVPGETQILGQCKDAFERSFELEVAKTRFRKLYQNFLQTAKYIRRETDLGKGAVSVSSVAVQLAKSIFDNLAEKSVMLIGAGEMCELAGEHFQASGVKGINIVNRSYGRAQKLADKLGGAAYSFDDLEQQLLKADIVLSSTGADSQIIDYSLVKKIMRKRGHNPMFFIDIAMPRDIDPKINDLNNVFVYNIDALQKLSDKNLKARQKEAVKAESLLDEKVREIEASNTEEIGPLIVSLRQRAKLIKTQELDKLYRQNPDMSDDDRKKVERSVDLIINKLLHDPIISLRRGMNEEEEETQSRSLGKLFKDFFNL